MKQFRVYADTSVYGGCFDEEFAPESRAFFEAIRRGRFKLVISPSVLAELQRAPEQVRRILADLPEQGLEMINFTDEVGRLRDAYLEAGILGPEHQAVDLLNGYREIRIYSPREVVANEEE